jgi:hypothetical protein
MRIRCNYRKLTTLGAIVIMMLAQIVTTSVATTSPAPAPAFADADINAESKTLDAFVIDLARFDKKSAELGKKATIAHLEYELHERTANDLKRRLSEVQNALREAIRKLKAAGNWDNLDQIVLAKISDARFQAFVRSEGFKKTLEELATGLSNNANEIARPLEALRNKVQGQMQDPIYERGNTARVVRVAYTPVPAVAAFNTRCRLAYLRVGFTGAFNKGNPSDRAQNAFDCYCNGDQAACQAT